MTDDNSSVFHKVQQKRFLTEKTFVLRFDREHMQFRSGQHIIVGIKGEMNLREYSIYSAEQDDFLEILVREVPDGIVSLQLRQCEPGQLLNINGPFGAFKLEEYEMHSRKLIFIASGTGISPFHSFVRSYPGIDYTLIHGVRYINEAYDRTDYNPARYILCTSQESNEGKKGRVTSYLQNFPFNKNMLFYICGNSSMIYEVSHILMNKGIPSESISTEVYF